MRLSTHVLIIMLSCAVASTAADGRVSRRDGDNERELQRALTPAQRLRAHHNKLHETHPRRGAQPAETGPVEHVYQDSAPARVEDLHTIQAPEHVRYRKLRSLLELKTKTRQQKPADVRPRDGPARRHLVKQQIRGLAVVLPLPANATSDEPARDQFTMREQITTPELPTTPPTPAPPAPAALPAAPAALPAAPAAAPAALPVPPAALPVPPAVPPAVPAAPPAI
jgi:hypothetical protein